MERLAALGHRRPLDRRSTSRTRPNVMAHVDRHAAGRTLMLSGHIDTKPAGNLDEWRTDPWEPTVIGDQLIGLGSGDMKAAIAAMIYAAAALHELGDFPGKLSLALTADEENGSQFGSKWLAAEGYIDADVCVIGEPAGVHEEWESIHLVSRGAALFKVIVLGTQMHSSISDQLPAVNATLKMAELALKMQRELRDYLTFDDHAVLPIRSDRERWCDGSRQVSRTVSSRAGRVRYRRSDAPGHDRGAGQGRRATVPRRCDGGRSRTRRDARVVPHGRCHRDRRRRSDRAIAGACLAVGARPHASTRRLSRCHRRGVHPGSLRMFPASPRSDPDSCPARTVPTSRCTRTEPHKRR